MLCQLPLQSMVSKIGKSNDFRGDDVDGNPFERTGYFKTWTMAGRAKAIAVPTLVINGIDEFASGDALKPFLDEIPNVRLTTLEGTTHSPHFERKEEYMRIVGSFLTPS
jgi:pimeloyl-ACP methyl ester carboxylesterase